MLRFVSGVIFGCLLSILGSAFAAGVVAPERGMVGPLPRNG